MSAHAAGMPVDGRKPKGNVFVQDRPSYAVCGCGKTFPTIAMHQAHRGEMFARLASCYDPTKYEELALHFVEADTRHKLDKIVS